MPPAAPRAAWWRTRASRSRRWSAPRRATWCSPRAAPRPTCWRCRRRSATTLLVSAIEHPSVRSGGRFAAAEDIPVTSRGRRRSRGAASGCLRAARGRWSPLMLANNETGVIQPVAEAAAIVHAAGGLLHVDAVQGPGRIACDFKALGADLMTLSSHKIGGPAGRRRADQARWACRSIRRSRAAARSAARGPAPRMWRASPDLARPPRRSRQGWAGEAARMAALRDRLEAGIKAVAPEGGHFRRGGGAAAQHDAVFGARA